MGLGTLKYDKAPSVTAGVCASTLLPIYSLLFHRLNSFSHPLFISLSHQPYEACQVGATADESEAWEGGNCPGAFLVAQMVKLLPAMQETKEMWFQSLGWEDPLEKKMATRSSILDWRIPRTEKPGGL